MKKIIITILVFVIFNSLFGQCNTSLCKSDTLHLKSIEFILSIPQDKNYKRTIDYYEEGVYAYYAFADSALLLFQNGGMVDIPFYRAYPQNHLVETYENDTSIVYSGFIDQKYFKEIFDKKTRSTIMCLFVNENDINYYNDIMNKVFIHYSLTKK